jgi:hypothetical protein
MVGMWSGDDWEDYCELLCSERHAPAGYQRVPDTDRGDLGLEGFSVDGHGCGYQCYATKARDVKARYEAQRDKMTTDLSKLSRNASRVGKLLGTHKLHRWIFLVPVHDSKELVMHARAKEAELRGLSLDFLAEEFAVVIQTDADFGRERALIADRGAAVISVLPEEVEPGAVDRLRRADQRQVRTMDKKLAKILSGDRVTDLREQMLRSAVDGGNIRDHLRRSHPQIGEQVERQVAIERRDVLAERDLGETHKGSVLEVRKRLETRLHEKVAPLGDDQASRLAHATVARWLMECPLDFPESK